MHVLQQALNEFVAGARRLVVVSGAGCSTESGIPDYRSPGGAWSRHKPIQYVSFVRAPDVRRLYWARSYRGWPRFDAAPRIARTMRSRDWKERAACISSSPRTSTTCTRRPAAAP